MGRKAELSIADVAKIMKKDAQYVRYGLQQRVFPFGNAVQKPNGRWSYNIIPFKFYEYMGINKKDTI